MEAIFWSCAAIILYTYFGYPIILGVLGFCFRRKRTVGPFRGSVSIVLVVHDEEANLARRLSELTGLLKNSQVSGEVVVVSDGSRDQSASIARQFAANGNVRVLERLTNDGKAAALTAGCQMAQGDILVFADARQRWAEDALTRLLENFADPAVGAVSGNLHLETSPGVMSGVGLYWRFEKWLRKLESGLFAQVGVTGAISAVRRELFRPIPAGTLLDDVYWPLQVALQGKRVVHDDRAVAYDRLPPSTGDEFRRKLRTLAGNFQLLARLPVALVPWRNPVWFQLMSHKLLRLLVPWAMVGLWLANLFTTGPWFQGVLLAQGACYLLALIGLTPLATKVPLASAAASFLVLNAAAFLGFWVWLSGRAGQSWRKIAYQPQEAALGAYRVADRQI